MAIQYFGQIVDHDNGKTIYQTKPFETPKEACDQAKQEKQKWPSDNYKIETFSRFFIPKKWR